MASTGMALVIALFLATVANRLVEGLVTPLFVRQGWDKFFLLYVSWAVGAALVLASGVNLFVAYIPSPAVGLILTALVAGGGANLLHDLFDKPELALLQGLSSGEPGGPK